MNPCRHGGVWHEGEAEADAEVEAAVNPCRHGGVWHEGEEAEVDAEVEAAAIGKS